MWLNQYLNKLCTFSIRRLDAFNVCGFGECRVFSDPKVTNAHTYLAKTDFYGSLPVPLKSYEGWKPSFAFAAVPGGVVNVVGFPRTTSTLADVRESFEEVQKLPSLYLLKVLIPAMKQLPFNSRTRRNNLLQSYEESEQLPTYLRVYPEDLSRLSNAIVRVSDSWSPLFFTFMTWRFGQQMRVTSPLSLENTMIDQIVNPTKVEGACYHVAFNFGSIRRDMSHFWFLYTAEKLFPGKLTQRN